MSRIGPRSLSFNVLLHLLLPGLGHLMWREYLFGVFIFLILLLATVMMVVSLLFPVPTLAKLILYGLPLLFYAFTFVDLTRTVKRKQKKTAPSRKTALVFLLVGLGFQFLVPLAPVNFAIRNRPDLFILQNNRLTPLYSKGQLLKASRLAYLVDIFVVDQPILHTLPQRYDIVRFVDDANREINGLVVGLPGEDIVIVEGVIVVNGAPDIGEAPGGITLTGDWPETTVANYSLLVATVTLGRIDEVYDVPLTKLIGKVEPLL